MQKRRNSRALATELRLSCTKPSIYTSWNINPMLFKPFDGNNQLVFDCCVMNLSLDFFNLFICNRNEIMGFSAEIYSTDAVSGISFVYPMRALIHQSTSHYQKQCWNIDNWTLGNKLQWKSNLNAAIFIDECDFENVVWKLTAILPRPQCVKAWTIARGMHLHHSNKWTLPTCGVGWGPAEGLIDHILLNTH